MDKTIGKIIPIAKVTSHGKEYWLVSSQYERMSTIRAVRLIVVPIDEQNYYDVPLYPRMLITNNFNIEFVSGAEPITAWNKMKDDGLDDDTGVKWLK